MKQRQVRKSWWGRAPSVSCYTYFLAAVIGHPVVSRRRDYLIAVPSPNHPEVSPHRLVYANQGLLNHKWNDTFRMAPLSRIHN